MTGAEGHPAQSEPVDLTVAGEALLARARAADNGHASQLLIGGSRQRVVFMALRSGASLSEHESPPAATFQVVQGSARLYETDGREWVLAAGQLMAIPGRRHGAVALEDCLILLTVALDPSGPRSS